MGGGAGVEGEIALWVTHPFALLPHCWSSTVGHAGGRSLIYRSRRLTHSPPPRS